jgi:hypothetical protein
MLGASSLEDGMKEPQTLEELKVLTYALYESVNAAHTQMHEYIKEQPTIIHAAQVNVLYSLLTAGVISQSQFVIARGFVDNKFEGLERQFS